MEPADSTESLMDMNIPLSTSTRDDDIDIITHASVNDDIGLGNDNDYQEIFIDEVNEPNLKVLSNWFINEAGILPSLDRLYCSKLFDIGIGTIPRLAKKISQEPSILSQLGFREDDIAEIIDTLTKDGLLQPQKHVHIAPGPPAAHSDHPFSPHVGVSVTQTIEHQSSKRFDYSAADENKGDNHTPSYEEGYVSIANVQLEPPRRRGKRGENSEKFKELVVEASNLTENLKTAIEGKMEIAVSGELQRIALFVENSSDKQKAMNRANSAATIVSALSELGGSAKVCEKALLVIALLCRHSDENKASVSYENAKALGNAGACECVAAALVKYAEEPKIVEVALDSIRCLCCLESNQARFGATTACETVGRCLSHPAFSNNADLCCWICRALGHLAASLDENRELVGSVGTCEHIIVIMQRFQHNLGVCIELCWAIRNVAPIYNNRARFANEHGPECIAAIYKFHYNSETFAIEACRALISLIASEDDDLIPRIANSGVLSLIFKSYKRFNDSEFLARWVFNLMYYIACDVRLIPRLLSVDILSVLSVTFDNHAGYEPLAEWGLRTVSKLTKLPGIVNKMRNAGLCEVTVSTVQRQAISAKVCGHGCLTIGELAIDVTNHDRLSTAGASEAVIGALKRHDAILDVVSNACYAIHFLCSTENINSWMGANGACEAVTNALIKHTETSMVVTIAATRALGSLAYHDEGNIQRLSVADACNAVVTALQTYASDSDVSEFACRAIYNLCYDEKNVKDLGKKGACAWVVAVLQKHADKSTVVTQACLAIHGLAVRVKNERIHPGNTRKLVEKGAIETVVAVMQKFPQNAEVQQAAALAIASLGRLEPNRILLGSGGACELIITGMNNHSSNGEVIGKLALAVEVLATKSETHTAKFADGGVVEVLLQSLSKNEKNSAIISSILRALIMMIPYEPSRVLIRSEPTCKQVVKVLRLHEKEEQVAMWGCHLIYVSATDDMSRSRYGAMKGCEAVVATLNKLGEKNSNVASWGCKALFALSVLESNKPKFANTDSCQALVKSLKEHYENEVVAEWACAAIASIAPLEGNRSKLGAGGCQALQLTLQSQQKAEVIIRLACEAIYELSSDTANKQLFGIVGVCETLVLSFRNFSESAIVSQQICRAISALARKNVDNSMKFGAVGVCELLAEGQKRHNFTVSFAEWSCASVTALADHNKINQSAFGAAGICETLIALLKTHRSNEIVVAQATRAVRAVSLDHDENIRLFSIAGAVGTTLASLKAHAVSFYVAENCGWILACIPTPAFLPEEQSAVAEETSVGTSPGQTAKDLYKSVPAWDLLASVLSMHYQREQTSKWISCAIQTFADRGQLSHVPVCDALMTTLIHHSDKEKILHHVLMTIGALAAANAENGTRLVKSRVCETIDAILIKYSSHIEPEAIYGSCFRAVTGLVSNNPTVQERFYSIPTFTKNVVKALYNDLESELVSKWGCAAIAALCNTACPKYNLFQYRLGPAGSYLVDIIQIHRHSWEISLDVCKAVSRLSHKNITNRNRLGSSGICDDLPKIIHAYSNASAYNESGVKPTANYRYGKSPDFNQDYADELIVWAVRAIADLAANNPNNQTKLGISGCCEALVSVLKSAVEAKEVTPRVLSKVKFCCWAIGNMVQLGKGPTMVIDEQTGLSKLNQLKALRATSTTKNTARFGAAELPKVMKAVLMKFSDDVETMTWCLRAVNNLAKSRTTRGQLLSIGVLAPVQLLASGATVNESIGSEGNATISSLTISSEQGSDRIKIDGHIEMKKWAALAKASLSSEELKRVPSSSSTVPNSISSSAFFSPGGEGKTFRKRDSTISSLESV